MVALGLAKEMRSASWADGLGPVLQRRQINALHGRREAIEHRNYQNCGPDAVTIPSVDNLLLFVRFSSHSLV
jgi:hypothetical protein